MAVLNLEPCITPCTVWKSQKFTHTPSHKNSVKSIFSPKGQLISRFFSNESKFLIFPHCAPLAHPLQSLHCACLQFLLHPSMLWWAAVAILNARNTPLAWMAHVGILAHMMIPVPPTHFAKWFSTVRNVLAQLGILEIPRLSAYCLHVRPQKTLNVYTPKKGWKPPKGVKKTPKGVWAPFWGGLKNILDYIKMCFDLQRVMSKSY